MSILQTCPIGKKNIGKKALQLLHQSFLVTVVKSAPRLLLCCRNDAWRSFWVGLHLTAPCTDTWLENDTCSLWWTWYDNSSRHTDWQSEPYEPGYDERCGLLTSDGLQATECEEELLYLCERGMRSRLTCPCLFVNMFSLCSCFRLVFHALDSCSFMHCLIDTNPTMES